MKNSKRRRVASSATLLYGEPAAFRRRSARVMKLRIKKIIVFHP
jgi:hypothetical protein